MPHRNRPKFKLDLLRGVPKNAEWFPKIDHVLFSASYWARQGLTSRCQGHAMLHPILPGDVWPSSMFPPNSSMPVEVSHVHVEPGFRSKGLGGQLMHQVMQYARRKNWRVVLRVAPYGTGDNALTDEQLVQWYERFGFVVCTRMDRVAYMVSNN